VQESGPASAPDEPEPSHGLSSRAIAIALIAVVCLCVFTPYVEFVLLGTQIGAFAPPAGAVLALLALLLINPVLRRFGKTLRQAELLTIYAVLLAVAVIPSCQFAGWIFSVVTGPFYYGNPENQWHRLTPLMPKWWGAPSDMQVIRWFYEGLPKGQSIPWRAWSGILLAWGPFIVVFYLTIFCLAVLLRKQWVDRERLAFPLVQLPLEMTAESGAFWRNRLLWLGAAVPIVLYLINGLARYVPNLPTVKLTHIQLGVFFRTHPWHFVNPFAIGIIFSLIGFAYMLPRSIPFSVAFFYLMWKAEQVIGGQFGWTTAFEARGLRDTSFPLIEAQSVGAVVTVVVLGLWTARPHLREVWASIVSGRTDPREPASYRWAGIGALAGFLFLSVWAWQSGMALPLAMGLFLLTLLYVIGVHRMMAEGGINLLWAAQSGPNYVINALGGAEFISPSNWLVLLCLPYFIWNFKGPVGPQMWEAFKVTDAGRPRGNRLVLLIVAALVLAVVCSYWATLYFVHARGGGVALDDYRFVHVGQRPFQELSSQITNPEGFSPPKVLAMLIAGLFTLFLAMMRWRYLWFPFHPLGYAVSTIWAAYSMWFSLGAGAAFNFFIVRYGGLRLYHRLRPFFVGLILGEFIMIGFWTLVDALAGARRFMPYGF